MIKRIWYYIWGYLIVELKGNALERLFNKMSSKEIELWDIKRVRHGFCFKMKARDYSRIRPILRYRKCTVRITKKKGLPFLVYRSKQRKAFFIGIMIFFMLLKILTSIVWFIEIEGNEIVSSDDLQSVILSSGIQRGSWIKDIDLLNLEKTILKEIPKILWIDASLKGTRLQIKIVEKKLFDKTELTDIIATNSGIITQMIVFKGKSMVQEGDIVQKGQLLIQAANNYEAFANPDYEGNLPPYLPPEDEKKESAQGIIRARVWYEGYGESNLIVTEEHRTGKSEKVIEIKIGSKVFHFSGPRMIPYEHFQVENETKSISLWRKITLPIEINKKVYMETVIYREERSLETTRFLAKEEALKSILNSLTSDAIIIQANSFIIEDGEKNNNIVRTKVLLEVEENVALRATVYTFCQ